MSKKYFISFADKTYQNSLSRIYCQALKMNVYDDIICANEDFLSKKFLESYSKYLKPGIRGFGYWSWKPQIILQALDLMNDGDMLQYTDAGCHLNVGGKKRLLQYFDILNSSESGILAFQAIKPELPLKYDGRELPKLLEFQWAKGDLIDHFGIRNCGEILNSEVIGAGIIFIKKSNKSKKIIQEWSDVIMKNFSLLDDSRSKSENIPGFIEHRHDQSIFSILCKLNKVKTLSAFEYSYPNKNNINSYDWDALKNFPIHAKRDKKRNLFNKIKSYIYRRVY